METNFKTMSKVGKQLNQIRTLLGMQPTMLAEAKLVDGTAIGTDAEKFEDGVLVYVAGEDGEKIPLPSGEYELADGSMMNVVDGEIREMKEPKDADESLKDHEDEKEKEDDMKKKEYSSETEEVKEETEEVKEEVDMSAYALKTELVESLEILMNKVNDLEEKLAEFNNVKDELDNLKKLSAQKPIKHNMSTTKIVEKEKSLSLLNDKDRVFAIFNKAKNK